MAIPKPQLYRASKIAVGAVLYSCDAWTDDAGKTSTEISEWVVRSIQARRGTKSRMGFPTRSSWPVLQYVNITKKVDLVTWGKRSTKHGDYGWLPSIPSYCKRQFAVGNCLPSGIYSTIRAAVLYETNATEDLIASYKADDPADIDHKEIAELEAQYAALQRRLSKLDRKPVKTNQSAVAAP